MYARPKLDEVWTLIVCETKLDEIWPQWHETELYGTRFQMGKEIELDGIQFRIKFVRNSILPSNFELDGIHNSKLPQ